MNKALKSLQSKTTAAMERVKVKGLLRDAVSKGNVKDVTRLANCTWEGAALSSVVMPREKALRLSDYEVRSNKRHQYGLPPIAPSASQLWICVCGKVVGAGHNHSCPNVLGPATLQRHESVVDALEAVCKETLGLHVRRVPRYAVQREERKATLIPDF